MTGFQPVFVTISGIVIIGMIGLRICDDPFIFSEKVHTCFSTMERLKVDSRLEGRVLETRCVLDPDEVAQLDFRSS